MRGLIGNTKVRLLGTAGLLFLALALSATLGSVMAAASQPDETDPGKAASEYTIGIFLLESDAVHEAIPHLESAWQLSGGDVTIGEKLAEAYFRVGDLVACGKLVDLIVADDSENYEILLLRAKIQYLRNEKEDALTDLEHIKATSETTFEVERLIAKVLFELGRDREAMDAYERTIELDPSYPFIHYKYGLLLRKFDRLQEAEAAFKKAVALEPRFSEASMELAAMLIESERYSEAELVLGQSLEHDADNHDGVMMLANLYMEQGKLDDAIRLLETGMSRTAMPKDALLLLGRLYYEASDYDEALSVFKSLFENGYRTSEMARVLGEISLKGGKSDDALKYYRDAIAIDPDDYRNYMALFFAGSARFNSADGNTVDLADGEMSELLSTAADKVEVDDFNGTYLIGVSYQSLDSLMMAETYLRRAYDLQPNDERVLLNLAAVLEKMVRYDEAETYIATLYDLDPEDPTVCNFYGYLLSLMGKDLDKAEKLVRSALQQEPQNGYYVDSLGWIFYARGDYEKAVIELEKASNLVRDDPTILEHLGDAYRSLKRYREALVAYEKSLDLQGDNTEILEKIDAARKQLEN